MLSTMNLPVRSSSRKDPRKHFMAESPQSQSPPLALASLCSHSSPSQSSRSDLFGAWDSTDEDHLEDLPSLGHMFSTYKEMITYTKEWALTVSYALVIARTTKIDDELTRIYLRCNRGGKLKAE
jgi:hypothetical protein